MGLGEEKRQDRCRSCLFVSAGSKDGDANPIRGLKAILDKKTAAGVEICQEIVPVTLSDPDRTLDLLKRNPTLTSWVAVHAAVMLNNGLREIISADMYFDRIPGIRRVDPGTAD